MNMRLPNKITTLGESIISKFSAILKNVEDRDIPVLELYTAVKPEMEDVETFLETLDCLYALGKIDFNEQERTICYVGNAG
jgi:hypothetical protein